VADYVYATAGVELKRHFFFTQRAER